MKRSLFAAALLMSTAWWVMPAQAQVDVDRGANVAVTERPKPEYDARGIRVGAFTVLPSVTFAAEFTDNIYAADEDDVGPPGVESDVLFSVRPYVSAQSNWGRHSLSAAAGAKHVLHQDVDGFDHTDYEARVDGRLDVLSDSNITAGAAYYDLTESRLSAESDGVPIGELVDYTDRSAYIGASTTLNRIRLSGRVENRDLDFEDATGVDEDYRDRNELTGTARVEYGISPSTAVVLQVGANKRDYDVDNNRDSTGREVLVGFNTDITNLVRGEILVGQTEQEYDDGNTVEGLAVRASAKWFPSEITTVSFRAEREVVDTGVGGAGGATSALTTRGGVRVDHELLRNVILSGGAAYSKAEYEGYDRKDNWFDADIGVTYLMNRNVGIGAGYYHTDIDSTGALEGRDIKVNRVMLSLTLKM